MHLVANNVENVPESHFLHVSDSTAAKAVEKVPDGQLEQEVDPTILEKEPGKQSVQLSMPKRPHPV